MLEMDGYFAERVPSALTHKASEEPVLVQRSLVNW
jgi:hypothetical protein